MCQPLPAMVSAGSGANDSCRPWWCAAARRVWRARSWRSAAVTGSAAAIDSSIWAGPYSACSWPSGTPLAAQSRRTSATNPSSGTSACGL